MIVIGPHTQLTTIQEEGFVTFVRVPPMAKDQVLGVLEVFQRAQLTPSQEWLDFRVTLAGQAAIAIESAMLFDGLLRSNQESSQAYNATLEGWSRGLALRHTETEGHSRPGYNSISPWRPWS